MDVPPTEIRAPTRGNRKLDALFEAANGSASSSLKPRMATAFTLIGATSGWRAIASRPLSTWGSESRRVIRKKRSR